MNAKQFAWFYLINNGQANVKPSYYGGYEVIDRSLLYVEENYFKNFKAGVLAKIKTIGIDWDKTSAPESESFSQFTDTFHDPEYKEFLTGTLVFKDNSKIEYMSDPVGVTNVFDMMALMDKTKAKMIELFGDI